ncbi:MAG: hypothetical protein JW795_04750 [Chitinivibrionales bacterium]|nr:hypothetical protein [Chitinivibrionales bacterium]
MPKMMARFVSQLWHTHRALHENGRKYSLRSNRAYLDALAPVADTAVEAVELSVLCSSVQKNARTYERLIHSPLPMPSFCRR